MTTTKLFCFLMLISSVSLAGRPSDYGRRNAIDCSKEQRAVVVGSSVTLGFFGESPATLYLKQLGYKDDCIEKKSFPIGDSESLLKWLKKTVRDTKPKILIALDYLIHDVSFTHSAEKVPDRITKTNETIDYLASLQIPVVIGSVFPARPDLYPYQLDIARAVNSRLCAVSAAQPYQFYVLPITKMYREIYSNTFKFISLAKDNSLVETAVNTPDMMQDYYHPGPRGAYMMTSRMIQYLNMAHNDSERFFPFVASFYRQKDIFNKDKHNDYAKWAFNAIEEDDKYSLDLVNAGTIPENMGDEACTYER